MSLDFKNLFFMQSIKAKYTLQDNLKQLAAGTAWVTIKGLGLCHCLTCMT